MTRREESDEKYILDLVAEVLAEPDYRWQHRFPTLLGDPDSEGRRRPLPVDGYFPRHRLVIEYWERQHSSPVAIMDEGLTVSGISRGHQRRVYDERRRTWAQANGLRFVVLDLRGFAADERGRLRRDPARDRQTVADALRSAGALEEPSRLPVDHMRHDEEAREGCLFCSLVQGDSTVSPHAIVWRDSQAVAFLHPFPAAYGHLLVAPAAHRGQMMGDVTLHEYLSVQRVVYAMAQAVRSFLRPEAVYILCLGSQQAGSHLHWHIVPSQPGRPLKPQQIALLDTPERDAVQLTSEEREALTANLRLRLPAWMREREQPIGFTRSGTSRT